jgi:hypothetical protein
VFRTSDLVLATLLHMEGYEPEMEVMVRAHSTRKDCVWTLEYPEDEDACRDFEDLIENFTAPECRGEPRAFAREWAEVRARMFQHLDGRR